MVDGAARHGDIADIADGQLILRQPRGNVGDRDLSAVEVLGVAVGHHDVGVNLLRRGIDGVLLKGDVIQAGNTWLLVSHVCLRIGDGKRIQPQVIHVSGAGNLNIKRIDMGQATQVYSVEFRHSTAGFAGGDRAAPGLVTGDGDGIGIPAAGQIEYQPGQVEHASLELFGGNDG
ncbi:hypothetical protein Psfp_03453 [Pelotomaculum sp. FP]|nr:hypothetical protein Psfp_03453 [Pelotomaculum sp. FP]